MDKKSLIHFVGGARTSGGFALFSLCITHNWFCMKANERMNYTTKEKEATYFLLPFLLYLPLTKSLMASTFAQEIRWQRDEFFTSRAAARTEERRHRWHWYIKKATIGLACEKRHTRVFAELKYALELRHCRRQSFSSAIGFDVRLEAGGFGWK